MSEEERLAEQLREALAAEKTAGTSHSQKACDTGRVLAKAQTVFAPQHRWNAWLKEQGTSQQFASERIRIFHHWGRIPLVTRSSGVEACIKFLKSPSARNPAKKEELHATPIIDSAEWQIVTGDCIAGLQGLPDGAARLIFADPPYNIGYDYGDGPQADRLDDELYLAWCREWIGECARVLTDDGSFWVMIGDEYADYFGVMLREVGLTRRNWIKWYETFGVNCTDKFNRCSRHLFYCVKDAERFVFNHDAVTRESDRQAKYKDKRAAPGGKLWDDVWQIPRVTGTCNERMPDFPTQLPLALLTAVVGCSSQPGDLIVDPFSGSGTTGIASLNLGRRYLGIERQEKFADLSRKRLSAAEENYAEETG